MKTLCKQIALITKSIQMQILQFLISENKVKKHVITDYKSRLKL